MLTDRSSLKQDQICLAFIEDRGNHHEVVPESNVRVGIGSYKLKGKLRATRNMIITRLGICLRGGIVKRSTPVANGTIPLLAGDVIEFTYELKVDGDMRWDDIVYKIVNDACDWP